MPDNDYQALVEKESQLWGESKSGARVSWFDSPTITRHINLAISGRPDRDWLDHVKAAYFKKPAAHGLNVGCGHGELERHILKRDIVQTMHGFDISPGAIDIAKQKAQEQNLASRAEYFVADANYPERSGLRGEYDAVFASMALHHFVELEKCLDGLKKILKPGGLLVVNEFVGPYRFQWTDAQLDAANRLLKIIPLELRRNARQPGEFKTEITRPGLEFMQEHFAFESVCSDRIDQALKDRFRIVEEKPYGGTVLHLLFEAIMDNFKEETNREHSILVRSIIEAEALLLDNNALQHDHVFYICKNR